MPPWLHNIYIYIYIYIIHPYIICTSTTHRDTDTHIETHKHTQTHINTHKHTQTHTADYDPVSKHFILHTPSDKAAKNWISQVFFLNCHFINRSLLPYDRSLLARYWVSFETYTSGTQVCHISIGLFCQIIGLF